MFEYLKNSGYHLQWYGKNDMYSKELFEKLIDGGSGCSRVKGGSGETFPEATPEFYSFLHQPVEEGGKMSDSILTDLAVEFLDHYKEEKPFFLFMPLECPHPPYTVPDEYYNLFNEKDMERIEDKDEPEFYAAIKKYRKLDQLDKDFLKKLKAVYYGSCSYVDMLLGKVLDAVKRNHLEGNTTIIVASDHGDWTGDYGLVEKWPNAFDDLITNVPLIIKTPGNQAGHIVPEPVELFDIFPTVLELSDIKCGHTHFAKSLLPQLKGEKGDQDRMVFCEGGYSEIQCFEGRKENGSEFLLNTENVYRPKILHQLENNHHACKSVMLRTMDYKLIARTKYDSELYDLKKDPQELHNVYRDEQYQEIVKHLEKELVNWYIETADTVPFSTDERKIPSKFAYKGVE
ncbi:MAG: hypothetical protein BGN88_11625 [Clostridiales bacterium 43-6]|nr:MAG: hypothetical protein BGN88_11625 [Clostridiales bacterium 43-6]